MSRNQGAGVTSDHRDRAARVLTIGCTLAFVAITTAFHFIRTDLDPLARGISRYQFGRFGLAMDAAFVLFGVAMLSASRLMPLACRRDVC
jgi:hypothetical protein